MHPVKFLLWKQYRELFQVWLVTFSVALALGLLSNFSLTTMTVRYLDISVNWLELTEYALQFSLLYLLAAACNLGVSRLHSFGDSFESALPIDQRILHRSTYSGLAIGAASLFAIQFGLLSFVKLRTGDSLELFSVLQLVFLYLPFSVFVAVVGYRAGNSCESESIAIRNSIFWIALTGLGLPIVASTCTCWWSIDVSKNWYDRFLGSVTSASYKINHREYSTIPNPLEFVFPLYFLFVSIITIRNWHQIAFQALFGQTLATSEEQTFRSKLRLAVAKRTTAIFHTIWFDLRQQCLVFSLVTFLSLCATLRFLVFVNDSVNSSLSPFSFCMLGAMLAGLHTFANDPPGDSRNLTSRLVRDRFSYFFSRQALWLLPALIPFVLVVAASMTTILPFGGGANQLFRFEIFVPLTLFWTLSAFSMGQLISFSIPRAIIRYGVGGLAFSILSLAFYYFYSVKIVPQIFYALTIPGLLAPYYLRRNYFCEAKRASVFQIAAWSTFLPILTFTLFILYVNNQIPHAELPGSLVEAHHEITRRLAIPASERLKSRDDFLNQVIEIAGPEAAALYPEDLSDSKHSKSYSSSTFDLDKWLADNPLSESQFDSICRLIESLPNKPFFGEEESNQAHRKSKFCSNLDASLSFFALGKYESEDDVSLVRAIRAGIKLRVLFNQSLFDDYSVCPWPKLWILQLSRSKADFNQVKEANNYVMSMEEVVHADPVLAYATLYRSEIDAVLSRGAMPTRISSSNSSRSNIADLPFRATSLLVFNEARQRQFSRMAQDFVHSTNNEFVGLIPEPSETITGSTILLTEERDSRFRWQLIEKKFRTHAYLEEMARLVAPAINSKEPYWVNLHGQKEPSMNWFSQMFDQEYVQWSVPIHSTWRIHLTRSSHSFLTPINLHGELDWRRSLVDCLDGYALQLQSHHRQFEFSRDIHQVTRLESQKKKPN